MMMIKMMMMMMMAMMMKMRINRDMMVVIMILVGDRGDHSDDEDDDHETDVEICLGSTPICFFNHNACQYFDKIASTTDRRRVYSAGGTQNTSPGNAATNLRTPSWTMSRLLRAA